jgi:uncharacterized metal-binding protein
MQLLVTCSGLSNTGRLTSQAAQVLVQRYPGRVSWVEVQKPPGELKGRADEVDGIIILNGCNDCCATRKLRSAGIDTGSELIATELGIRKNGTAEVRFSEIETVVGALLTLIGRD